MLLGVPPDVPNNTAQIMAGDKVRSDTLAAVARCFQPRQWWQEDLTGTYGDVLMWVYRQADGWKWEVGYYMPDRMWFCDSTHATRDEAAERVRWLNGGK